MPVFHRFRDNDLLVENMRFFAALSTRVSFKTLATADPLGPRA